MDLFIIEPFCNGKLLSSTKEVGKWLSGKQGRESLTLWISRILFVKEVERKKLY